MGVEGGRNEVFVALLPFEQKRLKKGSFQVSHDIPLFYQGAVFVL